MSYYYYIKQAISQRTAFYIGKTRKHPITQRGNPMNKAIAKWIDQYGSITWRVMQMIPESKLHPEFGESFLINCFVKEASHLKLLNAIKPHCLALNYDKASERIVKQLIKKL